MAQIDRNSIQWKRIISQYRAFAGIEFEEVDGFVIVTQTKIVDDRVFTKQELLERARALYPAPEFKIRPQVYALDLEIVTPEWIQEQINKIGLYNKDITRQLGVTNSEMSLFLSGKKPLSLKVRSMFYYYFETWRLREALRTPLITAEELTEAIKLVQERKAKEQG